MHVHGIRFVLLVTGGAERNHRVILDVIHAPNKGWAAKYAVESLERTLPLLAGAQVGLFDGILKGKHRAALYRQGVLPVVRPRRAETTPTQRHYGATTVHRPDGSTDTVELHLKDNEPYIRSPQTTPRQVLVPFQRIKTASSQPDGRGRWYNEWRMPDDAVAAASSASG